MKTLLLLQLFISLILVTHTSKRSQGQGHYQNQGQGNQQNQGYGHNQNQGQGNQHNQGSGRYNQEQRKHHNQEQRNHHNQGWRNQLNQGQGTQQSKEEGYQQWQEQCNQKWQESVSQSQMEFAVKIYQQISSQTGRTQPNLFISPINIYITLSTLALGAHGKTQEDIFYTLGLDGTKPDMGLHEGNRKILQELLQESKDMAFKLGSEIFLKKGGAYLPQFQQYLATYYNTAIQTISFSDPEAAKKTINRIVSNRTNQKIRNMVSSLDSKTSMVLVDYAVFQGIWNSVFNKQTTEMMDFTLTDGTSVKVPMMNQWGLYKTYKDAAMDCNVVEVPYKGNISLFIILPKLRTLNIVVETLTTQRLKTYIQEVKNSLIRLRIPKVSFNQPANLKQSLVAMGLESMFSENANFLGASKDQKLQVSSIYHQAYINIDEGGTEMNSATDTKMNFAIPSVTFNVDRPFIMLIYQKFAETILGMGRVLNPSWKDSQQQRQEEM